LRSNTAKRAILFACATDSELATVVCCRTLVLAGDGHTIIVLSHGSALAYGLCDSGQLGIGKMLGACKV
jgi:alpha-tubulin suppressor-like RCC1 family protein